MTLKPTKTFKLSKATKRMMCAIVDKESRDSFKLTMIQAQLASEIRISTKESKD